MMNSVATRTAAGWRLRELRVSAGLTQEDLAARAGISPRALRALETGTAKRARPHTIEQIARALGLDARESDDLLKRWRLDEQVVAYDELFASTVAERDQLSALVETQVRGLRTISKQVSGVVGVTRRLDEYFSTRAVQVVGEGVDRIWQVTTLNPETSDVGAVVVAEPRNAHVGRRRLFASISVYAVELLFDRELEVGSHYFYGAGFDFRAAHTERTDVLDGYQESAGAAGSKLTLDLQFTPPALPINLRQTSQPRIDAPMSIVGALDLSPFGAVTVFVESTGPGVCGVVWDWPEEKPFDVFALTRS